MNTFCNVVSCWIGDTKFWSFFCNFRQQQLVNSGAMTFCRMTLSITKKCFAYPTTLSIMILNAECQLMMCVAIKTFILSIFLPCVTMLNAVMLIVIKMSVVIKPLILKVIYAVFHNSASYAEWHNAKCHYAKCHCAKCDYTEYHYPVCLCWESVCWVSQLSPLFWLSFMLVVTIKPIKLSVVMRSVVVRRVFVQCVIMLSVVGHSVVAP